MDPLTAKGIPGISRRLWLWLRGVLAGEARSLRGRLLYTLLALVAVLLLVQALDAVRRERSQQQLVRDGQRYAALNTAATFRAALRQVYRTQRVIGRAILAPQRIQNPESTYFLQDARDQFNGVASIEVFDALGRLVASSPPPVLGDDPAGQFLAELKEAPYYLSDVYRDNPNEVEKVRVASRVNGAADQALGFVSMELYTHAFAQFMPDQSVEGTNAPVEVLLDSRGEQVFNTRNPRDAAMVEVSEDVERAVKSRKTARVQIGGSSRNKLAGMAVPIAGTNWTVLYLQPETQLLVRVRDQGREMVSWTLAIVAIFFFALMVVRRQSLRPLVRLSAAARKLGAGDLALRVPTAEVREFEPLVEAFNRMAERLEGAQHELLVTNRELERRVQERTRQLEEEHEKRIRAERLSTVGLFSSAIAHDLRNPLNTVGVGVYWLKMRLADSEDTRIKTRVEAIERELQRAQRIIKTLLAFAKTGEPERHPTDLNDLMTEVVQVCEPPTSIAVRMELDSTLAPANVDRDQLFQVLENLVRNAMQAMPDGGALRVGTTMVDGQYRISIEDSGPGIPEEMLASVFDPLVTTKPTGTGLGLALSKRIVEAHGGRIWAENRPGARFCIDLPAAPPPGAAPRDHTQVGDRASAQFITSS